MMIPISQINYGEVITELDQEAVERGNTLNTKSLCA